MSAQLKGLLSLPQQATVTRSNQGYEAIVLTTVNTVVRKLTLNSNALASLGALHAHAPNLSYLSASGNALTTEGIREVHHLKQLVTLILSLNKLEKVPRSLSRLPRLQALILNGNAIRKLPTLEIPTLSALVLSHNELVSIPAGALAWLPRATGTRRFVTWFIVRITWPTVAGWPEAMTRIRGSSVGWVAGRWTAESAALAASST